MVWVLGQWLDLIILEDFSNLSDSVIHFAWDFLFLCSVLPYCYCPCLVLCFGNLYSHTCTHTQKKKRIKAHLAFLSVLLLSTQRCPVWSLQCCLSSLKGSPGCCAVPSSSCHKQWGASCLGLLLCHIKWCAWAEGERETKSKGSNYFANGSFRKTTKKTPTKQTSPKCPGGIDSYCCPACEPFLLMQRNK